MMRKHWFDEWLNLHHGYFQGLFVALNSHPLVRFDPSRDAIIIDHPRRMNQSPANFPVVFGSRKQAIRYVKATCHDQRQRMMIADLRKKYAEYFVVLFDAPFERGRRAVVHFRFPEEEEQTATIKIDRMLEPTEKFLSLLELFP